MSEMKIWPTIHTLLVQFAPRIAEAEAASSYDERIAIINGVSAHIAGKVEEQIAAAPDLLEALKWIAHHYANQDMNHRDFRVEAAQRAEAAIAKAEGKL